jgi:hypothetical protein
MTEPVNATTSVAAQSPSQAVEQSDVDFAVRQAKSDPSLLDDVLKSPQLNDAERDEVIQTLARDPDSAITLYGNDVNPNVSEVRSGYTTIANAIDHAYRSGAINRDDLVRISDANQAGNGAQRFVTLLGHGNTEYPGGTMDVLGDALWARNGNDGLDRKGAVLAYTSDSTLIATNLNTPEKRAFAFETLVSINESPLFDGSAGGLEDVWSRQALAGSGRLFAAHGKELVDLYTGAKAGTPIRTEVLAKFMSQTVFNPDAQAIPLDRRRDLVSTVTSTLHSVADGLFDRAKHAEKGSVAQSRAMEQLGSFTASISGGAAVALTEYSDKIHASQKSREEFADLVGAVVGDIAGAKLPVGNTVGVIASRVTAGILNMFATNPERPAAGLATILFDQFQPRVDLMRTELNQPELLSAFNSAYSAELLQLQQSLNVNLGGHER